MCRYLRQQDSIVDEATTSTTRNTTGSNLRLIQDYCIVQRSRLGGDEDQTRSSVVRPLAETAATHRHLVGVKRRSPSSAPILISFTL
jgi:hypothetical protein